MRRVISIVAVAIALLWPALGAVDLVAGVRLPVVDLALVAAAAALALLGWPFIAFLRHRPARPGGTTSSRPPAP